MLPLQFYEETCLLEQKYVQDDSQTVKVGCCCSDAAAGWVVCLGC